MRTAENDSEPETKCFTVNEQLPILFTYTILINGQPHPSHWFWHILSAIYSLKVTQAINGLCSSYKYCIPVSIWSLTWSCQSSANSVEKISWV